MTTKPAIICEACDWVIAAEAVHYVTEYLTVFCMRCACNRENHHLIFPNCLTRNHTADDHAVFAGTRDEAFYELHRLAVASTGGSSYSDETPSAPVE